MMLESVYKQKWENIELIFVNDGATDGTRERLSVWEMKLKKRGYDVIIKDQDNLGIPAAVKDGLSLISGDYVCLADCDDILSPDYVSVPADWLDYHADYDWTACLYNRVRIENNETKIIATMQADDIPSPPFMMEKYLSTKYAREAWIYMVRTCYLKQCRVIENYITDIRSSQEAGFIFPLITGNGKVKIVEKILYSHNWDPNRASAHNSASQAVTYQNNYRDIVVKTINNLTISNHKKKKWCVMAELAHKSSLLPSLMRLDIHDEFTSSVIAEAVSLIKTHFKPDPCITAEHIKENGYTAISGAIADCILEHIPIVMTGLNGRIIGCGALGKKGGKIIPELIGTVIEPTDLWDTSAADNDEVCGIKVTAPNYNSLTSEDTILVFPKEIRAKSELYNICKNSGAGRVLFQDDFLPIIKYPQFYNGCKFVLNHNH